MNRRLRRAAALVTAGLLGLAACGSEGDFRDQAQEVAEAHDADDADPGADAPDEAGSDAGDGDAGATPDDGAAPDREVVTLESARATDGTWAIGDAGTVTFVADGDDLQLVDVTAAAGWEVSVEDESRRKLELEWTADRQVYEVTVERRGRDLRIVVDHEQEAADPGTFELGGAGTIALDVRDDELLAADLAAADGWEVRKQDVDDDEVEVELRSGDLRVRFKAQADEGRVDLESQLRVEGPVER